MSRYIDADKALKDADTIDPKYAKLIEQVKNIIKAQPTAEVVEVVHCKDCKYYMLYVPRKDESPSAMMCFCPCCLGGQGKKKPTDYCSYGEREEVDNECK